MKMMFGRRGWAARLGCCIDRTRGVKPANKKKTARRRMNRSRQESICVDAWLLATAAWYLAGWPRARTRIVASGFRAEKGGLAGVAAWHAPALALECLEVIARRKAVAGGSFAGSFLPTCPAAAPLIPASGFVPGTVHCTVRY